MHYANKTEGFGRQNNMGFLSHSKLCLRVAENLLRQPFFVRLEQKLSVQNFQWVARAGKLQKGLGGRFFLFRID